MSLRRASLAAIRLYDASLQGSGLKITQFSLLRNIGRAGTINVTDLAKRMELERTAMGRNIDVLQRRGLIRTLGDKTDQRSRVVALTEEGQKSMDAALPAWKKAQADMTQHLKKGKLAALASLLEIASPAG